MKIVKKIFLMLFVFFVGIITVNAETKNIKVTDVTVKEKSTTIEVADPVISDNEITSNITFNQLNDYVTFELTLKNNESEKYKITSITDNNTNTNLEVEYDYSNDFIASSDEAKVRVKLTYKNQLTNSNVSFDNLTITFNVENASGDTSQIVLNPNTGDNVFHYLVLLIIAITGLILIVRKKKTKIGALVLALGIIIIPFAVLAEEKFEINFKFSNIEVKGKFESYNVTVDKGDGTEPTVLSVTYGETIGELPDAPQKTGHTFVGWIDEENREISEDTIVTGPMNITPVYSKDKHQLTITNPEYIVEGDISGQYEYGTQITLTAKAMDGFTFSKWSDNSTRNPKTITIGTSDITIEPIYVRTKYTITFRPNGGSVNIESKQIEAGSPIGELPNANYLGHALVGWYTEAVGGEEVTSSTVPTGNVQYYAHWEEVPLITYTDLDNSGSITQGDSVKIWNDEFYIIGQDDKDNVKLITKNSLNYHYRQSTSSGYRISFSDYNYWMEETCAATSSSGCISSSGDSYLGNYDLDSFGYANVYRTSYNEDTDNNVRNLVDQYANYIENDIGVDIADARLMTYEEANALGCKVRNEDGYENSCPDFISNSDDFYLGTTDRELENLLFVVGYNNNYVSSEYGLSSSTVRPVILLSENLITSWTVEFDSQGGSTVEDVSVKSGNKIENLPVPTRNNYAFMGWYTDTSYTTQITEQTKISGNKKYYAKWFELETRNNLQYGDIDNDNKISAGDFVRIGSDDFWIVNRPSDGKINLLARFNLDSNSRQTSNSNYPQVSFSDDRFWRNTGTAIYPKDEYSRSYVYRNLDGEDTATNLYSSINQYREYLSSLNIVDIKDARAVMLKDELAAGCSFNYGECPYYLSNQNYWMGSESHDYILSIDDENTYIEDAWYTRKKGIRPVIEIDENVLAINYYINYDAQYNSVNELKIVNRGSSIGYIPPQPERLGWHIEGWYTDTNYTTKVTENTIPTYSTTYYAKWVTHLIYTDSDTSNTINRQDLIRIGDDEFYVLESPSDGKVKLITKELLNKASHQGNKWYDGYYVGTLFSNTAYWLDSNGDVKDIFEKDTSGYYYVYRDKYGNDMPNNIAPYINNYKDFLISNGASYVLDARMPSYAEVAATGCDTYWHSCPAYMDSDYFVGSINNKTDNNEIWYIYDGYNKQFYSDRYDSWENLIRPVVIIELSAITD